MITEFVADASVAAAWVHPAQATPESNALLRAVREGATVRAPALLPLETANALLVLARRGRLEDSDYRSALSLLSSLQIELDHEAALLAYDSLSDLANKHRLSLHDAAYLEPAMRHRLPIACKDGPLRESAKRARVKLAL